MKRSIWFTLFIISAPLLAQQQQINLIPQPVEMTQLNGLFEIKKSTTISYASGEAKPAALLLADRINRASGYSLLPAESISGTISFRINKKTDTKIGTEGYSLNVDSSGISIAANRPAGLFYAVQTLLQLLPKEIENANTSSTRWQLPAVKIIDYPRFAWRGIMLDVSRNFFSKKDVMSYIDQIARYKYNTFHWHLTDDQGWRIEIKAFPRLTQIGAWRVPRYGLFSRRLDAKSGEPATVGGFYTQEDIREIVAYAQDRCITVIPEIDLPGHCMALVASYPELSCTKDTSIKVNPGSRIAEWYANGTFRVFTDNTVNPSDEKVYEFIDKVFTEVAALFPNPYIHVGGDECYKGFWSRDSGCRALMKKLNIRHVEDLQGYFMNRVEKILKAKGKKLLGWDEILDGGISPEATVMSWRGMRNGIEAANMGHDVVMTPTTYTYLDFNQGDQTIDPPVYASLRVSRSYSFEPVPENVDPKRILGGQGNLWAENVPHLRAAEYLTYPRAWALSEVFWSPKEKREWNDFVRRMEYHFTRLDAADVNYSRAVYDAIVRTSLVKGAIQITLAAEIPDIDIFFTTDDTMPDDHSKRYTSPILLPEGPITLRVQNYRNGKPIGHLITLQREELERRASQ